MKCDWCLKQKAVYACEGCLQQVYCGEACFQAHYGLHQQYCGTRLGSELQYTLLRMTVDAQLKWYGKTPPTSLLLQQHTIAELESDSKKLKKNAAIWATQWPDRMVRDGVKSTKIVPTKYKRGQPDTKSPKVITTTYHLANAQNMWYNLILAHGALNKRDQIKCDVAIAEFFQTVAPVENNTQVVHAKQLWFTHTEKVETTRAVIDTGTYYKQAVHTIKQSIIVGEAIDAMMMRRPT